MKDTEELLSYAIATLEDMKADNIVHVDVRARRSVFDYMIIATGNADRHVRAIAQHLETALKHKTKATVRLEGLDHGDWVLVDAGIVIIHVMTKEMRNYYQLEELWHPTPTLTLPTDPLTL